MAEPPFGYGQLTPSDAATEYGVLSFIIRQHIARLSTVKIVQVKKVHADPNGGPPTVDVQPLVNQLDGQGNATPWPTIFNVPAWRLQSGSFAFAVDPTVNDIGVMICADSDFSAVQASKAAANPGSYRRFDSADGIYIGALFGSKPTASFQYANGVVTLNGADLHVTGAIIAGFGGADPVNLETHKHAGVTTGGGVSGSPVAGT